MAKHCLEQEKDICFDDDKFKKLDEVINEYRDMGGALIPVLHKAQEIFGFLPEVVQYRIAQGLGVPLADVYGVVTFYALFTMVPKGEYKISVCLGTACYVKGAGELVSKLQDELGIKTGEITEDRKFSIEGTRCIGACGLAPVVTVNDEVHGRLNADQLGQILDKYR
jgi:NADH:ubiquinone oxidoreductase subunit E